MVDDLGLHDPSYTGSICYETPNIDRIAKEGTVNGHEVDGISYGNKANKPKPDAEFDTKLVQKVYRQKVEELMPRLEAQRKRFLFRDFEPNKDWWDSRITKD